jgi:phage baseplate assembly protein W
MAKFQGTNLRVDFDAADLVAAPTGNLDLVSDSDNVAQSVICLVATRPGEIPLHPELGSPLWDLLGEPMNDAWLAAVNRGMGDTLVKEPRIDFKGIEVLASPETGEIAFVINYVEKATGDAHNLVWQTNPGGTKSSFRLV